MPLDGTNYPVQEQNEQETLEPFTLPHFVAWLRTMPADRAYRWAVSDECALGLYARANGKTYGDLYRDHGGFWFEMECAVVSCSRTFGAALERAERAMMKGVG